MNKIYDYLGSMNDLSFCILCGIVGATTVFAVGTGLNAFLSAACSCNAGAVQ